jgi:hypothetical protein
LLLHFCLGGIPALKKFKKYAGIFDGRGYFLKGVSPNFFYFDRSQYLFGFLRMVPKMRAYGYFLFLL